MWPQITMIALLGTSFGMDVIKHGEPRTGKHNMGYSFLACAIYAIVLWFGGFWNCFIK